MKYNHTRLIGFLILSTIIFLANSSNPPNGRTGAPGDSTCTAGCHSGTNMSLNGSVSITGLPAAIDANTTYNITVTVDNPNGNGVKGGFQWVALDANNVNVGTMSNPGANSGLITSGGRQYHEHQPAQLFNSSNEVSYTVDWTAPAGPNNEVITLHAGALISNGNGNNSGDRFTINTTSGTLIASSTPLTVTASLVNDVSCNGGNDGSATAMGTGGVAPYSFAWDNGDMTMTATGLSPGTHTVTVTDSAPSTATATIFIDEPAILILSTLSSTPDMCNASNGTAEVFATGGTAGYMYAWSTGDTGPIATGLTSGNYTCTVTDNNLCTDAVNVGVGSDPGNVMINLLNSTDPLCFGGDNGSIEIEAMNTSGTVSYMWSNGDTSALNDTLVAGSYTVTVIDAAGCQNSATYTINQPTQLQLSLTANDISCFGAQDGSISATASGGTAPYQLDWSHGMNTSNLGPGTYFASVTDDNDCTMVDSIVVEEPALLALNPEIVILPGCGGQSFGTIAVVPTGGTAPYNYQWGIGFTTDTINVFPGFYPVTVTDANNCKDSTFVNLTVTDMDPPVINAQDFTLYLDAQGMTSMIDTSMFDLGSSDDCELDGGFVFDNGALDCSQDSFLLPISLADINGNIAYDTLTVTVLDTLLPMISCVADYTVMGCNQSNYTLPTAMDNCGITSVDLVSGIAPGGDLVSGDNVISYMATDGDGNTAECTFTITLNSTLAYDLETTDVSCFNFQDGTVNFNISGGVEPYMIVSDPMFDPMFLEAGTYYFDIVDDSGCMVSDSFIINEPPVLLIDNFNSENSTTSNSMDGSIMIDVSGGTGGYTFQWFLNGTPYSNDEDLTDLNPGTYTCEVMDSSGCIYNSIEIIIEAVTSTADLEWLRGIEIFPNPTSDILNIVQESNTEKITALSLYDLTGKRVSQINYPGLSESIEVGSLNKGLYVLEIHSEEKRYFKKVLVQ